MTNRFLISMLVFSILLSATLCIEAGSGKKAPDFVLPDIKNNAVRLENYRGKIVILNFWAFWCWTWKEVRDSFDQLYLAKGEVEFSIITISVDGKWKEEIEPYINRKAIDYPVLLDLDGAITEKYGVKVVPTLFIIDREGYIIKKFEGYPGNEKILKILKSLEKREKP